MTTMELKSLKMDLVEELLSINDKETLTRVKNYLKKLNSKVKAKVTSSEEEVEYITKEELLAGIDAGLKDMVAGRKRPLEELIKELEDEI